MFYRTRSAASSFAALALILSGPRAFAQSEPLAPEAEVAVIGSDHVTLGQLPGMQDALSKSQQRYQQQLRQLAIDQRRAQQAILERAVDDFVDNRLMEREAQARHVTVAELSKNIKVPDVTDADVSAFYDKNKQDIGKLFGEIRPAIAKYLAQQAVDDARRAWFAGLRAKYSAHSTLEPLRDSVAADGPSRGPKDARVTIVEFADFQCPYCRRMAPVLRELLEKYPRDVRLVYRQLPLTELHPDALHAAEASLCAREQGRFWEMHDALFADQGALDLDGLKTMAAQLQLQAQPFADCLASDRTLAVIRTDTQAATELGVNGTPGLFVNGRYLNGAVSYEEMAATIDDELLRTQAHGSRVASRAP